MNSMHCRSRDCTPSGSSGGDRRASAAAPSPPAAALPPLACDCCLEAAFLGVLPEPPLPAALSALVCSCPVLADWGSCGGGWRKQERRAANQ